MMDVHPVARFAVVQVLVIVLSVFCTGMMLKMNGHPDLFYWPVAIRNGGVLFLAIPALWAWWAARSENNPTSRWTSRWTVISGMTLLALLSYFFYCSTYSALFPPVRERFMSLAP